MNCSECKEKALDLAFGLLSEEETRRVKEHTDSCPACAAVLEGARSERRTVDSWTVPEPAPTSVPARIAESLKTASASARKRRGVIIGVALAAILIITAAVILSLIGPLSADSYLVISGPRVLLRGSHNILLAELFSPDGKPLKLEGDFAAFLDSGKGTSITLACALENGAALGVAIPKETPEGTYAVTFSGCGKTVRRTFRVSDIRAISLFTEKDIVSRGETFWVSALVRDNVSGKPLQGQTVNFAIRDEARGKISRLSADTDDFGLASITVIAPADFGSGALAVEGTCGGAFAAKITFVRNSVLKIAESADSQAAPGGDENPPTPSPSEPRTLRLACYPDGGTVLPGQSNRFFIRTSYADGTHGPCRVVVDGEEMSTDVNGFLEFSKTAGDSIQISASDDGGLNVSKTLNLRPYFSEIALNPANAVMEAGDPLVLDVLSTRPGTSECVVELFRMNRLIAASTLILENGTGRIEFPTSKEFSGTLRVSARLKDEFSESSDPRTPAAKTARNVFVKSDELLSIKHKRSNMYFRKKTGELRTIPYLYFTTFDEFKVPVPAALIISVAPRGAGSRTPGEINEMCRILLGDEFSTSPSMLFGENPLGMRTAPQEKTDRMLAGGLPAPPPVLVASSRMDDLKAAADRREAVFGFLVSARFIALPILLAALTLLLLMKNASAALRPEGVFRRSKINSASVLREIALFAALGVSYFAFWSFLSTLGRPMFIIAQFLYPCGALALIYLITRRSAFARMKNGILVDRESRMLEFGILLAAFAPTQFFGPGGGLVPAISHMEYFSLTLGAVIGFIIFAGFISFFREPAARRIVVTRWSPALAAAAVAVFAALIYLPATGIGTAHREGVMSAFVENHDNAPEFRMIKTSDGRGHAEMLLPSSFGDGATVTVVAVGADGRTGAETFQIGIESE